MLPFVLSQFQRGAKYYLRTTFPSNTPPFHSMLSRFFCRVKFPVLRKYGQNKYGQNKWDHYIIYTRNGRLAGVGFRIKRWRKVKEKKSGTVGQVIQDDTQPSGPVKLTIVYEAPFTKCDREADYTEAWAAFEARESDQIV